MLVQLVSLLPCQSYNDDMMMYVQMHDVIRGECGCAVASLWLTPVHTCSRAIGPRHPSYLQNTEKKFTTYFTLYLEKFTFAKYDVCKVLSGFRLNIDICTKLDEID